MGREWREGSGKKRKVETCQLGLEEICLKRKRCIWKKECCEELVRESVVCVRGSYLSGLKVPSIIGGGSFVQQRGQTVVGLSSIFLSLSISFSLMTWERASTARPERTFNIKKMKTETALERPSMDRVVCMMMMMMMMMMDHVQFPIQAIICYTWEQNHIASYIIFLLFSHRNLYLTIQTYS